MSNEDTTPVNGGSRADSPILGPPDGGSCSECGGYYANGGYCRVDGTELGPIRCGACSGEVLRHDIYCGSCGAKR